MGNCCKPCLDEVDSEGDSRERLAMHDEVSSRARLASFSDRNSRERSSSMASLELIPVERMSMFNRGEGSRGRDRFDRREGKQLVLDDQSSSSIPMYADNRENRRHKMEYVFRPQHPSSGGLYKARQGGQVADGWPSWLSEVAGEALKGWMPRKLDSFKNLVKIGQGTYSDVYRAIDLEKGKVVALKKVKFDNLDPESISFMAREIRILCRLDHPNVIKLEGVVTSRMSYTLYLVFEYMEHDLTGLASCFGLKFTEPQIKCFMKQLLRGIDYCHRRGILHRDIKGSNLLVDNNGTLKIADFGLANIYYRHQLEPMTNRVVTLWYRPPELLLGATRYGPAIDLWSIGCVLAELYAGKPIMIGRTEMEQLHEIFKLCGSPSKEYWRRSELPYADIFKPQRPCRRRIADRFKDIPAPALSLIETLLSLDPAARGSAARALNSEFFSSKPLACEPEELPKYPPRKDLDARVRDEEARRQAEGRSKGGTCDVQGEGTTKLQAIQPPVAKAYSDLSMERKMRQCHIGSEKFNPRQEEAASGSGSSIKPPRAQACDEVISGPEGSLHKKILHSGPFTQRDAWDEVVKNMNDAQATRKPGSYNEAYDFMRNSNRDPLLLGYGSKSSSHNSGPLLPPAINVNQMLPDQDHRQVQEKARHDKGIQKGVQSEAFPLPTNALFIGPRNRPKK